MRAMPATPPRVVGVVRIWETAAGDWWGGRLGVHRDYRTAATIGRRLVQAAVGHRPRLGGVALSGHGAARERGASSAACAGTRWSRSTLFGQPHHLMEADLALLRAEWRQRAPGCAVGPTTIEELAP